jgi:hypothetical protein
MATTSRPLSFFSTSLVSRIGTRPLIVAGSLIAAAGLYWLSQIPVDGSFTADLLPGMLVVSFGLGLPIFTAPATSHTQHLPAVDTAPASALTQGFSQRPAAHAGTGATESREPVAVGA